VANEDKHARSSGAEAIEVEGIKVAPPLTRNQGRTLASNGLLADGTESLMETWLRVVAFWTDTVREARSSPGERQLTEKVNGEWSFIETLRHLVFVTDSWIGMGVLGSEFRHPLGLPPHFVTNGKELGLDLESKPDLDAVLLARTDRQKSFEGALHAVGADLGEPCLGPLADFTRLGAFQVVIAEEWFHRAFAIRDLATLTGS
jgi:hypothetical protein